MKFVKNHIVSFCFVFMLLILVKTSLDNIGDLSHIEYLDKDKVGEFDSSKNYNYINAVPKKYYHLFNEVCFYFPELKNETIELQLNNISTTMQARPKSILKLNSYVVVINSDIKFKGIQFDDVPPNAKLGIIAHELCHLLDYKNKSIVKLAQTGIGFIFSNGRIKYERAIDLMTIKKGFGKELKDWSQYSIYDSKANEDYKQFKKTNYLNPSEIEKLIKDKE